MSLQNKLILRTLVSQFTGDLTKNSVLSWEELDGDLLYLKGELIYTATTSGGTVTLHKNNGDVITYSGGSCLTAGTVIISATTDHGGQIYFDGPGCDFYTDLKPMAGSGLTVDNSSGQYMLDLGTTLPSPAITSSWVWRKHDNTTQLGSSSNKNISVPHGAYVDLTSSQFQYILGVTDVQPITITGDYGTTDLGPNTPTPLTPISQTDMVNNTTFNVTFSKPSSGLVVVGNQIQFASGNDTTSDTSNVTFKNNWYFGFNSSQTPTDVEIEGMIKSNLINDNPSNMTISNITAPSSEYTIIAYPSSFGPITNIIMDGAAPVLGAFTQDADSILANSAGLSVNCHVYHSNAPGAFTNNTLLLEF